MCLHVDSLVSASIAVEVASAWRTGWAGGRVWEMLRERFILTSTLCPLAGCGAPTPALSRCDSLVSPPEKQMSEVCLCLGATLNATRPKQLERDSFKVAKDW